MHLSNCLHPQVVFNKYTRETLYVPCGKCAACLNSRAKRWIDKMNQEANCWKYTFSLYLDYDEENVPYYQIVGDYLVEQNPRFFKHFQFEDICIPIFELKLDKDYEFEYVYNRLNDTYGIPHVSVRDIQTFKKRLNKYLYKHVTGHYQNFRSCIASEFGPSTFRGHYHGVIFFNDDRIAKEIGTAVAACWKFGHSTCEPPKNSKGAVVQYVTQYLARPTDLPAVYAHSKIRPFFLTSRHPPIGSLFQSSEEVLKIFNDGSCERVQRVVREGKVSLESVPLSPSFKARLFPKCPRYSTISDSCRIELYRCLLKSNENGVVEPYDTFEECWLALHRRFGLHYIDNSGYVGLSENGEQSKTWLFDFFANITDGFKNFASIVSLYRNTKRMYFQSLIFGVTYDEYIQKVLQFYNNFSLYQLKKFYEFQFEYSKSYPVKELLFCYPEYVERLKKLPLWLQERKQLDIKSAVEFRIHKSNSESIYEESHKRQKQNAYIDSLKYKNPQLFHLINCYYAKKCNEVNEAVQDAWSERLRFVPSSGKYFKLRRTSTFLKYPYCTEWKV